MNNEEWFVVSFMIKDYHWSLMHLFRIRLSGKSVKVHADNNSGNCLLNHIIILGKYTIYSCRCKNIKPSVSLLKAKTSETRKFEFLIAKKNKKESIHYKKWENMLL